VFLYDSTALSLSVQELLRRHKEIVDKGVELVEPVEEIDTLLSFKPAIADGLSDDGPILLFNIAGVIGVIGS